ncbi:MAG: hypothetical protein P794_10020 [Epsilonproteobacteria bacterium (ex Lamellibrachia satsuma)]|nr:MAG: hypothetical protein P794_10020 [Epsilonproteobacteria bacterium (ex Lamellibrachia satsuma)]
MQKMTGKLFLLAAVFLTLLSADDNVVSFYKDALKTLTYKNTYMLQEKSRALSIEAKKKQRYLNLDASAMYGTTKAALLPHRFNSTDIGITDTIDLFGKNMDDIHLIQLKMKEDKLLTEIKKEKLFLLLTEMITAYHMSEEKWQIKQKLYQKQLQFLKQLKSAVHTGAIPELELIRFENTMTLFKVQIDQDKQTIDMMKAQLKLYSKHHPVPHLSVLKLHSNLKRFLSHSPQLKLNDNQAVQSLEQVKKLERNWLPDAVIGANQQYNDDPTANGDNYTLSIGLSMKFDGSTFSDMEKQKVDALRTKSLKKELEIQRKAQYIAWKSNYQTAKRSFYLLNKTVKKTRKTLENMRTAYLQHYIDLNSYLQMMQEDLATQDARITAKYSMIKNAIILNTLSRGTIYK